MPKKAPRGPLCIGAYAGLAIVHDEAADGHGVHRLREDVHRDVIDAGSRRRTGSRDFAGWASMCAMACEVGDFGLPFTSPDMTAKSSMSSFLRVRVISARSPTASSSKHRSKPICYLMGERAFYRPPPPKKPLASRRICDRMNGSGSAPMTIAPGWPHGVQQTILALGVLRGMAVMPGVGFGYPCSTYVPCLCAFRASADEETEKPRAQTSNPSMTDVLSLLAMTMEFLHRFLSAPGN
jgi:hypothetical protein